jgi:hypothetical protein
MIKNINYRLIFRILYLKLEKIKLNNLKHFKCILYFCEPFRLNEIIHVIAMQLSNANYRIHLFTNVSNNGFTRLFTNCIKVIKSNMCVPGTPVMLLHVLRYTAQYVQHSLDHKKKQINIQNRTALKTHKKLPDGNSVVNIKANASNKKDLNNSKVMFNLSNQNHYLTRFLKLNSVVVEKKRNSNVYEMLSWMLTNDFCITSIIKANCKSLSSNIINNYLSNSNKVFACPDGKYCPNTNYDHFFEMHLQPLFQNSIFPPLPMTRVGIKRNFRKKGIAKIAFEAAKANYLKEVLDGKRHNLDDLCGAMAFGKPIPLGTGYNVVIRDFI